MVLRVKRNFYLYLSGLVLVTDAISALGLKDGIHKLGQLEIEVRHSRAYIAGTDTLCGSIANMSECVQFFKEASGNFIFYSQSSYNILYFTSL